MLPVILIVQVPELIALKTGSTTKKNQPPPLLFALDSYKIAAGKLIRYCESI